MESDVFLYCGEPLARYGFPEGHPFGTDRQEAFWQEAQGRGLDALVRICAPVVATRSEIERFHTPEYVNRVILLSALGTGYLDYGDTPAFPGAYEAAACVVGTALDGLKRVMNTECLRTFQPIGGLHHARRSTAAGFCVFNDVGVVIETLRREYGVQRVAYVDIDVHHGDGVFYSYEADPDLSLVDIHEDGNYLYPGTGFADETGKDRAEGTKLNVPMPPGAGDQEFYRAWEHAEAFLEQARPEFILFQCGADSIAGDPLAHLCYSPAAHAHAARSLCAIADECSRGRIMAFGGGGYHPGNLARAWCAVLAAMIEAS